MKREHIRQSESAWVQAITEPDELRPGVTLRQIMLTVIDLQMCLGEMKSDNGPQWRKVLSGLSSKLRRESAEFEGRVQERARSVRMEVRHGLHSHTGSGKDQGS